MTLATRRPWLVGTVCALALFAWYWLILSEGQWFPTIPYGFLFNSMVEHLARGEFNVDPASIGHEGFTRAGRTYAYFGIFPALLRAPVLLLPQLRQVDFTALSVAIAATLAAVGLVGALWHATRPLAGIPLARPVTLLAGTALLLGGPQVPFLRASVYQEPITWASAFAAFFLWLALRWVLDPRSRQPALLVRLAVLAGLCLITRVSVAMGLYLACGWLMLLQAWPALRGEQRLTARLWTALRQLLPAACVLASFILLTGFVNHMRWGTPFTFVDYGYYNALQGHEHIRAMARMQGLFNLERVPFNLSYYVFPVWVMYGEDGRFVFRAVQDRLFQQIEYPPASFLLSDAFLLLAAGFGGRRSAEVDALCRPNSGCTGSGQHWWRRAWRYRD